MGIRKVTPLLYILIIGRIQFAAGDCSDSWTTFDDSCYTGVDSRVTWMEANELCKMSHSHLVEITTQEEQQFMSYFIHQMNVSVSIWIGLSDILTVGEWSWTMSLQKATFTAWRPGDPNDPDGHCAALRLADSRWYHHDCHASYPFVCEKSARYSFLVG